MKEFKTLYMDMGLLTEYGELIDIFKKKLAYGKEIDYVNLGEECVDILWYQVNKDRLNGIIYSDDYKPSLWSMGPLKAAEQKIKYKKK